MSIYDINKNDNRIQQKRYIITRRTTAGNDQGIRETWKIAFKGDVGTRSYFFGFEGDGDKFYVPMKLSDLKDLYRLIIHELDLVPLEQDLPLEEEE